MNSLKTRNKDPDKGNNQEKWLLKPRTIDKYTIISITMHLICVYIYNILDLNLLGFFFSCQLVERMKRFNPPTCVLYLSKIIIIVYSIHIWKFGAGALSISITLFLSLSRSVYIWPMKLHL